MAIRAHQCNRQAAEIRAHQCNRQAAAIRAHQCNRQAAAIRAHQCSRRVVAIRAHQCSRRDADGTRVDVPSRRALLIGIDAYQPPDRALTGCVNDVELMRDVLVDHFQFAKENVTLLTDAAATRLGILQGLEALLQATQPGDNVVVHYAGHGSQMTDREGDEPGGLDSTWHTVDSNAWDGNAQKWVGENRDITDDEIAIWIEKFAARTEYLTIVVDACHSGGISRDASEDRSRGSKTDDRPVAELPPSPIGHLPRRDERSVSGWGGPAQRYALIAGCRDEERSMEVLPWPAQGRDKAHGALTWFLTRNLLEAEAGTTYKDIFEMATAQVTREVPGQHPQMEGRIDREIFGITDLPAARYRLVTARNDRGEVTLRGGAAHGVTVGSKYAVYPPGAKTFSGSAANAVGEIVVTSVQSVTSTAQIVDKSESAPGAIGEMCRAVETARGAGATRYDVAIVGAAGDPHVAALRELLKSSSDVGLAADGQPSAFRADYSASRGTWLVTDAIGKRVAPAVAAGDEALVASNIQIVARWQRLLTRQNADPTSGMTAKPPVRLDLLCWQGGAWVPAPKEADGTTIVYDAGEKIGFRVKKDYPKDLFMTLLDLDPTGSVVRVWPNTTVSALRGATSFDIVPGSGDGDWTIGWPTSEAMEALSSSDGTYDYVEENWILLVTVQQADFKDEQQPGTAASRGAVDSNATRAIVMGPPKLDDDWTVVRQAMKVRRPKKA